MKFAFIIMGNFDPAVDKAEIGGGKGQIVGVNNMNRALDAACRLVKQGVDCIELCGAFGEDGAREIIAVTENKVPVGYVTHLPMQDRLYEEVFSK